jgi:hypothetical protein
VIAYLDFMAGEIGECAAAGLIFSAFLTLRPTAAFLSLLFFLCGLGPDGSGKRFRWILPKKKTHDLARLSIQEACNYFGNLIELTDQDDYRRSVLFDLVFKIEDRWAVFSRGTGNDFLYHIFFPSPMTVWMSN